MTTNEHQEDLLAIISAHANKVEVAQAQLTIRVVQAYRAGCSWRTIGLFLGTSGQAAWSKYRQACGALEDDETAPI